MGWTDNQQRGIGSVLAAPSTQRQFLESYVYRTYKITLMAVVNGRFEDAAEMLQQVYEPYADSDDWGEKPSIEHFTHLTRLVACGTRVVVQVGSQADLNSLAGYFWVTPRRID